MTVIEKKSEPDHPRTTDDLEAGLEQVRAGSDLSAIGL